ncbi:LytTR family two component transcriptional regulator [Luteibacter rhizovicinus]|uniref:LytTR family two component transcriptional regulator n=1 Tax=Luteibacter rhizovicinus TaxID=242606 RepID=A0A4R3YYD8_9GAMM|nr:LytTR family DNA-binding domain-containing protein [Luteibacter rhizovicinus]TCV96373.1 LytTR family two component transcriptional regulator [Luteibacter rhizovicinus]
MPDCIIAEDEALLRDALASMLRDAWPSLDIAQSCEDGGEALDAIATHHPDIAFLDIRMPGLNGLQVAAAAAEASPSTLIVFVTAYDQHAIEAFDRGAIDYLLKPVTAERLERTLARVRARLAEGRRDPAALATLANELHDPEPDAAKEPLTWITASAGRETRLILIDDVVYFRADSKYTLVATAEGEALLTRPLRDLLRQLDPRMFRQIHRSTIVNLRQIASVIRDDTGKGALRLRNRPETLSVSQPFMALFRAM